LRCFAAINIVFFHFSNPQWFGFLAPVVNSGFISVSYFILLSGFVLAYNYSERARSGELDRKRFYEARFTRIYPIYLLGLLLSLGQLKAEYPTPYARHVLDGAGADSAAAARLCSGGRFIPQHSGLDDVGRGRSTT
jgi:peptidoglycan/LPS O-acetylase OafA/YrhL